MRPVVVSKTGVGTSTIVPVNYAQAPFNVGVAAVLSGTATFSIQHTYDNIFDLDVTPNWFTDVDLLGKTANVDGAFVTPIRAIRVNITSGTGTVTLTVLQGNPR